MNKSSTNDGRAEETSIFFLIKKLKPKDEKMKNLIKSHFPSN